MNGLIRASLRNPYAVTVMVLTIIILGVISVLSIPVDILPVFNSPAVQALTFYSGMPAESIEKDITARMERWTGQAAGTARQESRSIVGASIIRNYYRSGIDPNGALTQVNSLATAAIPTMPPGTLPPVILPFDPTSTVPACLVALDSKTQTGNDPVRHRPLRSAPIHHVGPGRGCPGGLRRQSAGRDGLSRSRQAASPQSFAARRDERPGQLQPVLCRPATRNSATPTTRSTRTRCTTWSSGWATSPIKTEHGNAIYLRDVAEPKDANFIQTNVVRVNGRRQVYIPVFRQLGMSTLDVVERREKGSARHGSRLSRPDIGLHLVMDQSIYVRASIRPWSKKGCWERFCARWSSCCSWANGG